MNEEYWVVEVFIGIDTFDKETEHWSRLSDESGESKFYTWMDSRDTWNKAKDKFTNKIRIRKFVGELIAWRPDTSE